VGVGDSENDVALLEACDVACIIPRPHKPLLSLSIPLDRTIIAGSIAPLGWLEAVRKALAINNTEKVANYG
jgi:predicted mannosyl-3-phosphoglycerate phosphatase (HAD superfamily)